MEKGNDFLINNEGTYMTHSPISEHNETCKKAVHCHLFPLDGDNEGGQWRVEVYNMNAPFFGKGEQRNLGVDFPDELGARKCHDLFQVAINIRAVKGT